MCWLVRGTEPRAGRYQNFFFSVKREKEKRKCNILKEERRNYNKRAGGIPVLLYLSCVLYFFLPIFSLHLFAFLICLLPSFHPSIFFIRMYHVMSITDHPIRSGHHVYIYIYIYIYIHISIFLFFSSSSLFYTFFPISISCFLLHLDGKREQFAYGKGNGRKRRTKERKK